MHTRIHCWTLLWTLLFIGGFQRLSAQETESYDLARSGDSFTAVRFVPATRADQQGMAAQFTGTPEMHYYAIEEVDGFVFEKLALTAQAPGTVFGPTRYPPAHAYRDPALDMEYEVYAGDFTVFLPFETLPDRAVEIRLNVKGQICSNDQCQPPFDRDFAIPFDPAGVTWTVLAEAAEAIESISPPGTATKTEPVSRGSTWFYFLLAIGAGLSINIMPCVLPVIPLVIMKLLEQSKQAGKQRLLAGFTFCCGIVAFFAVFAAVAAVIQLATGRGINPNDLYRYPAAGITLFLFIVFFGLVMLDIVPIVLPGSLASRQTNASSLAGSLGMGFFAGILSIPCSGALLGFVLVWAQTQTLAVSSLTFILIGVGMALPYAVLISIPRLMERIPKPGAWMERFKQTCGFLLFLIAAKLSLAGLPKERLINVLMYGIVFSFSVWMWGQWVTYSTPSGRKRLIRGIALIIAVLSAVVLLPDTAPPPGASLNWESYDASLVSQARSADRPVLIKFTADWCTNCKKVEKQVYQDPEMVRLIEARGVLVMKGDTTTRDLPATQDLVNVYGEAGNVPVTIVLLAGQEPHKLRGIDIGAALRSLIEPLPAMDLADASVRKP
jgi:thiol:disulfide interchange protein DsbD